MNPRSLSGAKLRHRGAAGFAGAADAARRPSLRNGAGPNRSPSPLPSARSDNTRASYSLRSLFALAVQRRRELIVANTIAFFATLASAPLPLLMPLMVDEVLLDVPGRLVGAIQFVFPESWHGAIFYIAVVLSVTVVLRLLAWLLAVWQMWIFARISKNIIFHIRRRLLWHLSRVSIAEYETAGGGTISSYLVTDLATLDQFFSATISRFLISVLMIIATAFILLFLHWQLALFLLLLNPVVIYFTMSVGKHVKELKGKENKAIEVFQQAVVETLSVVHQIRASNRERHYIGRLVRNARDIRNKMIDFAWRNDMANRFSFLIFLVGFDVFRALGMLMVLFSDLSIGEMIAVFGYLWFMLAPIQEIINIQYAWFGAKAAVQRVNRILALAPEPHYPPVANPFHGRSTVSVAARDLNLAYGENTVLRDVSLYIAPGEKVAIVGASGGGKTTFVHAMLGLYPARSGHVAYGGVPIDQIGLEVVRENVGCVLQHPLLFNDTIRENVTLGRDVADARLWDVLKITQMAAFVRSQPRRLDTMVGLQGLKLSGGQRQRLAIARMLLGEPKVVIFDEATSAVDARTESDLYHALHDVLKDRTVLIIAHRLSAVRQADRVYVFENGQIVERGNHARLIEEQGLYAKLFSAQL